MDWLVCSTRGGVLSLMTRVDRENLLIKLRAEKKRISTHVVKVFKSKAKARKYIKEIKSVNKLIDKL